MPALKSAFHEMALGVKTRLKEPPAPILSEVFERGQQEILRQQYSPLNAFDMAHAIMLVERKVIPRAVGAKILKLLLDMHIMRLEDFPYEPAVGDVLINRERYIIGRLGEEVGGRLHTGRSRGDVFQVQPRINTRERMLACMEAVTQLEETLVTCAAPHGRTVMPGYTHFQHAQPTTYGHYLLSWAGQFARDFERLEGAYQRTNRSPAGAAILTGSRYPLDRHRVAELLGFDAVIRNTREAAWSFDYVPDAMSAAAIMLLNASRLSDDLDIWSTYEFRLVECADRHCGTSSIMPQKKNPFMFEYIRGAAGLGFGIMMAAFGILKTPSEEIDIKRHNHEIFRGMEDAARTIRFMAEVVGGLKVRKDRMAELAGAFYAQATDLADVLVLEKDLPFRTAHRIVGRLVREAVDRNIPPHKVTPALLQRAAREITGKPLTLPAQLLQDALDPAKVVAARKVYGSPSPREFEANLSECRAFAERHKQRVTALKGKLVAAEKKRLTAARAITRAAA
jgi:argininosuccinate lyase